MSFTPIQTNRLTLRRLTADDAPAVYAYRADPRVSIYQSWNPQSLEDVQIFLKKLAAVQPNKPGTWFQLAIVRRDDNILIGDCGIRFPGDDSYQTEMGISLSPSCQGQGFASEALLGVLDYVFGSLHKHRVFASIDPRNLAAIALMKRTGMRPEAHFRESILINGEWVDDMIFAMLESEWRDPKA